MKWKICLDSEKYKKNCNLEFINSKKIPDRKKVTSVLVIPFLDEKNIVFTRNTRGLDVPGGHLEDFDNNFEDACFRETLEETGVEIENIKYLGALESDYFGKSFKKLSYMLIYKAKVKKINEYNGNLECSGREIMNISEFLLNYDGKNKDLMKFILKIAFSE